MSDVKDPFATESDQNSPREPEPTITETPAASTSRKSPGKETSKQDKPEVVEDPDANPQFYVWLANGEILRVDEEDVPTASGTNAQYGHWQRGNDVHTVVGVYPAEVTVKG